MKTLITLTALAGLLLTGCGPSEREKANEFAENTFAVPASPSPDDFFEGDQQITGNTPDEVFVSHLRSRLPDTFTGVPDENIVRMGQTNCDLIRDGVDVVDLVIGGSESGFTVEEFSEVVRASVIVYCFEYEGLVQ